MPTTEQEKLIDPEMQKPPENSAEQAASAAQAAKREGQAAVALMAQEASPDLEQMAKEIAQRYLETIPTEDRTFSGAEATTMICYILRNAFPSKGPGDLLSTYDAIGNCKPLNALSLQNSSREDVIAKLKALAENPSAHAATMLDKIGSKFAAKAPLPETMKAAVINIVLTEGPNNFQQHIQTIVELMQSQPNFNVGQYRSEHKTEIVEGDKLRQQVIIKLMENLYPELMQSEELKLL